MPVANPGPKNALADVLRKIGVDGRQLTEDELAEAQQYFAFNIADRKSRFRRLYELEPDRPWGKLPEDKLLRCELPGLNLIRLRKFVNKVTKCEACELHKEATAPVEHSMGRYNLMTVGEAPGPDEDEQGLGFVGRAGKDVLWPELKKYGLNPLMFHVTNICKCWPSKTKTPGKRHVDACMPYLEAEIAGLQPIVILAMGNTAVQALSDHKGGITRLSGTTEWSDKYECWISWCVHPAAVLRSPSNRGDFEQGIKNFADVLRRIGGYPQTSGTVPQTGSCPYGGDWAVECGNYGECEQCEAWNKCAAAASYGDWN
jgi:DNA polymerase